MYCLPINQESVILCTFYSFPDQERRLRRFRQSMQGIQIDSLNLLFTFTERQSWGAVHWEMLNGCVCLSLKGNCT